MDKPSVDDKEVAVPASTLFNPKRAFSVSVIVCTTSLAEAAEAVADALAGYPDLVLGEVRIAG